MSEFVGVVHNLEYLFSTPPFREADEKRGIEPPISLKREAMIFQRIAVPLWCNLTQALKKSGRSVEISEQMNFSELDWLLEKGIVFAPEHFIYEDPRQYKTHPHLITKDYKNYSYKQKLLRDKMNDMSDELRRLKEAISHLDPTNDYWKKLHEEWQGEYMALDEQMGQLWDEEQDIEKRMIATALRGCNFDAVPILTKTIPTSLDNQVTKTDVIKIVINALPLPDESTPWEHIIEYRSDADSYSKFLALRNWMNDVSKNNLTPVEIEQKLEYLLDQYQRHIQLHKMKTNTGTLQTVIVSTAEMIENLVTFKWGELAKSLFAFRERKIALLEGELTSPGSEIAYIVKARETF